MMDKGNLLAYTDETRAACHGLWMELGLDVIPGLIGNLSEEEKEKAASFVGKMSEVLIKKNNSRRSGSCSTCQFQLLLLNKL